jgi:hypothetical protein
MRMVLPLSGKYVPDEIGLGVALLAPAIFPGLFA